MPEKERQHYVPQMYLRGFLDPEAVKKNQHVLWRYRSGAKPQAKGTKVVAAESLFYNVPERPNSPNEGEDALAEVEGQTAKRLGKLRDGDIHLTPQEKSEFSTYVAIQLTRTPFFRKVMNKGAGVRILAEMKETLNQPDGVQKLVATAAAKGAGKINPVAAREAIESALAGNITIDQVSTGWFVKQMLILSLQIDHILESLHWQLLEAPMDFAFVTSDNPVTIIDREAARAGPKGFKFTKAMQFQFPISSRFLLTGIFIPGRPDERVPVDADRVRKFNRNQMHRAQKKIYASFYSEELRADFDRISEERPLLIPDLPE